MTDVPEEYRQFRDDCVERLGLSGLDIAWERSDAPGGDRRNIAHVHAGPDLRAFTVEWNFDDADEHEIRTAIVHESVHIALRHVGAVIVGMPDPVAKAWLTQAAEEDAEALAEALVQLWP